MLQVKDLSDQVQYCTGFLKIDYFLIDLRFTFNRSHRGFREPTILQISKREGKAYLNEAECWSACIIAQIGHSIRVLNSSFIPCSLAATRGLAGLKDPQDFMFTSRFTTNLLQLSCKTEMYRIRLLLSCNKLKLVPLLSA